MISKAKFVKEIVIEDPDSGGLVEIEIYKHENGGMFGIDSSYVDQVLGEDDEVEPCVPDIFYPTGNSNHIVILEGLV
jgi:hypothetical protein